MKKFLFLALLLAGCSQNHSNNNTAAGTNSASEPMPGNTNTASIMNSAAGAPPANGMSTNSAP